MTRAGEAAGGVDLDGRGGYRLLHRAERRVDVGHLHLRGRLDQCSQLGVGAGGELLGTLRRDRGGRTLGRLLRGIQLGAVTRGRHPLEDAPRFLPPRVAGVELQNSIRPMVAVARFVAFAAKALHDRPDWRRRIGAEAAERGTLVHGPLAVAFAQEVRRTAPFVPMLPGRARVEIDVDGIRVPAGGRLVLDLLGTDTDARSWERAESFDPERFVGVDDYEALAAFIPHGGGDVPTGHRCPGEKLAIAGLSAAIAALSHPGLRIDGAGLGVDLRRLPTKPASGGRVRRAGETARCPFHRR